MEKQDIFVLKPKDSPFAILLHDPGDRLTVRDDKLVPSEGVEFEPWWEEELKPLEDAP